MVLAVLSRPAFITLSESITNFEWLVRGLTAKRSYGVYDA